MMSGFKNDEAIIRKVLTSSKTIALIGASQKKERPSHYVMEYLLQKGYNVIPVNPGMEGKELLGQKVYPSLSSIPVPIDMVDIFRNSEAVPPIVEEAITIGAKSIWMQVGVVNEEAAQKAKDAGMDVVMNRCPKIEIPKFGISGPTSEL
jgi:predicted CoA-binding protein